MVVVEVVLRELVLERSMTAGALKARRTRHSWTYGNDTAASKKVFAGPSLMILSLQYFQDVSDLHRVSV